MNAEASRNTAPGESGQVSLLDMLQRYAFSFYEVVIRIEQLRSMSKLWAGMKTYSGPRSVDAYRQTELTETLTEMRSECDKLSLISVVDLISHIESDVRLKGEEYNEADMANHLDTLSSLFASELRRKTCFRMGEDKDKYFQKDDLFGPKVSKAFVSCVGDIQAAGNCYALEQWEASAFHSLRVLERGLGSLAKKFNVDFAHTNWQNVIEQVESKIRQMNSSIGTDWKEQQKFCSQAATHFMFLKDAWRNHFIHGRDIQYDEGRALSVFGHVREFMQALADGGLKE